MLAVEKETKENENSVTIEGTPSKLPIPIISSDQPIIVNRVTEPLSPLKLNSPLSTPKIQNLGSMRSAVDAHLKLHPEKVSTCETPASKYAKKILDGQENSEPPANFEFSVDVEKELPPVSLNSTVNNTLDLIGETSIEVREPCATEISGFSPNEEDKVDNASITEQSLDNEEIKEKTTAEILTETPSSESKHQFSFDTKSFGDTLEVIGEELTPNFTSDENVSNGAEQAPQPNQSASEPLLVDPNIVENIVTPLHSEDKELQKKTAPKDQKTPSHVGIKEIFRLGQNDPLTPGLLRYLS